MIITGFALTFVVLSIFTAVFQFGLTLGAPWGEYTMGGRYPGTLPDSFRVATFFQGLVVLFFGWIVLSEAGLISPTFDRVSGVGIWVIVAFFLLSTVLNSITNSRKERLLWAPIAVVMLASSLAVALG